jgi:xylulokinase
MTYLLGVDLGSTSLKGIVYDTEGNVAASGSRPTLKSHPYPRHPEWTVWEPEQIWGDASAAIREAVGKIGDPRQIRALAVTGMGMDGLPVDAAGRWLAPMISWHDPRTQPQHAWWLEHIGAAATFAVGGNPVWPINSALRILWMRQHEPEVMARADKWLLIEDFVNFMLCGRQATDYSMASCTLLFDQRSLDWSEDMLGRSGIDRRLFCDAYPSGTVIGEVTSAAAEATGLAAGTPVVLGGHDHLCGALPVGAFRPGVVLDVTGTWESVLTATEGPVLRDALRATGMTVQAHVARGMHAVWGGCVAGEMLEWFRRCYGRALAHDAPAEGDVPWEPLLISAAASPPGSRGAFFLPHMSGANCPVVDPRSLGAWFGLSPRTDASDMLRAVFEGLDFQFRDIVDALESSLATHFDRLVAVGGATRNAFWMQNKADVVGRPIEVPAIEEATPLGAAMLAGIGIGGGGAGGPARPRV